MKRSKKAPVIMVLGTGSHVGKSVVTAGLCRYFANRGYRVAPFKAQNMSNNSYVCSDGGEIGRAQAVQAEASVKEPSVLMNPILIKPTTDCDAQIIFMGRPVRHMDIAQYKNYKEEAWPKVCQALDQLREENDLVIAEGAGSPAEINLKDSDIVNMKVAKYANAKVLLVGDIDMGGVFAQFVGTLELLDPDERDLIEGFIVNKFRGDLNLLKPGLDFLEKKTKKTVLGVLPFVHGHGIAEEDALPHERGQRGDKETQKEVLIDVLRLPRISNFTDFDPFETDPRVKVRYLTRPPTDHLFPDMLVLPGTKSTMADLDFLYQSGLADYVHSVANAGKWVWGICGGFQMMGKEIHDPVHIESKRTLANGLGLLPHITIFHLDKTTTQVRGVHLQSGATVKGYEIHMGLSSSAPEAEPLFKISRRLSEEVLQHEGIRLGNLFGTYLHGVFDSVPFREWLIESLLKNQNRTVSAPDLLLETKIDAYDRMAYVVEKHLDLSCLEKVSVSC